MSFNFKEEVLKRKEAIINDLKGLIQINSELTTYDPNSLETPFGLGNKQALDYMLHLAKRDGFETENVDNYAGHIAFGEGEDYVAMIGHLDVVPAGNDWNYPPYGAEIHNNKMYGRGTEDDKGPTIAAYYAMKILKDLGVVPKHQVKLILGCDEETAWRCVARYFNKYPKAPVAGFVPDSIFPLTYAEKGISAMVVKGQSNHSGLVSFHSGFRDNMVPDYAKAVIAQKDKQAAFEAYLKKNHLVGSVKPVQEGLELRVTGKSAHGSTPEVGQNAAYLMVHFLNEAGYQNAFLDVINHLLLDDHFGEKLGVAHATEEMGNLTINAGIFTFEEEHYEITLNPRYPYGVKFDEVVETIKEAFSRYDAEAVLENHKAVLYSSPNSEMVLGLMESYRKYTNDHEAQPMTTGGGTFARATKNVVAFGPHFPGKPSLAHQIDEFVDLDDFMLVTTIYVDALYNLIK